MRENAKRYLLDTSALFCLKGNEPGAGEVERVLRDAGPKERVSISFISLMEFFYIVQQEQGEEEAQKSYLQLKQLPLQVVESDEALGLAAARFKARGKISVADAWIAATAQRLQATLIHKDPEFEAFQDELALSPLPYKSK